MIVFFCKLLLLFTSHSFINANHANGIPNWRLTRRCDTTSTYVTCCLLFIVSTLSLIVGFFVLVWECSSCHLVLVLHRQQQIVPVVVDFFSEKRSVNSNRRRWRQRQRCSIPNIVYSLKLVFVSSSHSLSFSFAVAPTMKIDSTLLKWDRPRQSINNQTRMNEHTNK